VTELKNTALLKLVMKGGMAIRGMEPVHKRSLTNIKYGSPNGSRKKGKDSVCVNVIKN